MQLSLAPMLVEVLTVAVSCRDFQDFLQHGLMFSSPCCQSCTTATRVLRKSMRSRSRPNRKLQSVEEFVYKLMATLKLFVNVGEGTSGHKTPQFEGS